jgi:hypothetical protein
MAQVLEHGTGDWPSEGAEPQTDSTYQDVGKHVPPIAEAPRDSGVLALGPLYLQKALQVLLVLDPEVPGINPN